MKFKYFLDNSAGWAGVIVEIGSFSRIYCVSDCLGDNITALLGGLVALFNQDKKRIEIPDDIIDKSDIYELITKQECSYEEAKITYDIVEKYLDENNNYRWTIDQEGSRVRFIFSLNNEHKKINLEIIEIDGDEIYRGENYKDEEKCVFKGEVESNELLDNVIESCDEILAKYGIIGYYENFWHEFPVLNFLMLKDYRRKKLIFDDFTEKCPHDKIVEMNRTNLKGEVEYLSGV